MYGQVHEGTQHIILCNIQLALAHKFVSGFLHLLKYIVHDFAIEP